MVEISLFLLIIRRAYLESHETGLNKYLIPIDLIYLNLNFSSKTKMVIRNKTMEIRLNVFLLIYE